MENFSYLKGVYNITPTPFQPNGALDETSLVRLTNFIVNTGVNGMTILGVLGESNKVSERERERIISTVVQAANGRIPHLRGDQPHRHGPVCGLQQASRSNGGQSGDGRPAKIKPFQPGYITGTAIMVDGGKLNALQ